MNNMAVLQKTVTGPALKSTVHENALALEPWMLEKAIKQIMPHIVDDILSVNTGISNE